MAEGQPKEIIDIYKKLLVNQLDSDGNPISTSDNESPNEQIWKESMLINSELIEYGGGEASIIDFGIFDENGLLTSTIEKGKEFTIKLKAKFNTEVDSPILAFTIKTIKGTEVTGTNTMYEGGYIEKKVAGDIVTVEFTQKIDLQGGDYLLSFGCTGYRDGEFTVYHRLYDVCSINVVSTKNTVGFYDMNSKVKITEK